MKLFNYLLIFLLLSFPCFAQQSGGPIGGWGSGSGSGDVVGPSSATDNAIARFDAATGKLIQNSAITIDDSGNLSTAGSGTFGSLIIGGASPPIVVIADADADPGVNDDINTSSTAATPNVSGYSVGDIFINDTASPPKYWVCVDNSDGAADWDHLNPETQNLFYHQSAYFDPDAVYDRTGARVELDGNTVSALTISQIYVRLGEGGDSFDDTELTLTFYQKSTAVDHSSPTTIGSGTTSSGVLTITSFTDATVPADYMIWAVVGTDPDATTIEATVVLEGTYD